MKQCKQCQLAFDEVNEAGLCATCAPTQTQQRDPEIDALKAQLQQSDARFRMLAGSIQQQQQPQQQQISPEDARRALNQQAWADPATFVQNAAGAIANQAVSAALANDHDTIVGMARDQARNMFDEATRPYFDKYQNEIVQRLNQYAPQFHRNVNVWKNTADQVIGVHFREILADQREQERAGQPQAPAVHISNNGPAAPSTRQAAPSRERVEELTPEGKRIASRLDITEDQMRQGIKDFNNQGDADDPSVPSSWDRVISFNRRTGPLGRRLAKEQAARTAAV
jgi:hypothetical protein